jgi:hypothetical protein
MSENFVNPLDNSEFSSGNSLKDLQPAAISHDELENLKLYMEVLRMQAKIESEPNLQLTMKKRVWDGAAWVERTQRVPVAKLLPQDSDFEKMRKLIILDLNNAGPESDKFRKLASRFQTNSLFTLSGKYAHFLLNKRREEETWRSALGTGGFLNVGAPTVDTRGGARPDRADATVEGGEAE